MVQLAELYRLHGLEIDARELPDYLPLFLDFLSGDAGESGRFPAGRGRPCRRSLAAAPGRTRQRLCLA